MKTIHNFAPTKRFPRDNIHANFKANIIHKLYILENEERVVTFSFYKLLSHT